MTQFRALFAARMIPGARPQRARKHWRVLCGAGLLLAGHALPALAAGPEAPARQWLEKIATSAQMANYRGTFVYRRGDQLVAMKIVHVAGNGAVAEGERLTSLNGRLREVIRAAGDLTYLLPERLVVKGRNDPAARLSSDIFKKAGELEKYYTFAVGRADRTAGRSSRLILVEPRDQYRYGYRLWADEQTGLLLQSDVVNEKGVAVEQVMFTQIETFNAATPEMVEAVTVRGTAAVPPQISASRDVEADAAQSLPWQGFQIPAGFALMERYRHKSGKGRAMLEQVVYSDGLASVSVFIEKRAAQGEPFEGESRVGAVNAFGRVLGDHQITVVGEVPPATVQLIGDSISLQQGALKSDD